MRVYNSNNGRPDRRRRIGEFNARVAQFKKSFSPEEKRQFRNKMLDKYGILI